MPRALYQNSQQMAKERLLRVGPAYKRPSKASVKVCQQRCRWRAVRGQNKACLHEAASFSPGSGLRKAAGSPRGASCPPPSPPAPSLSHCLPSPSSRAAWQARLPQRCCNNSCKCEGPRDKERSGQRLGGSCRQTILDVKCVPLTKVLI